MTLNPYRGQCAWCGQEVWARRVVKEVTGWELEGMTKVQGPDIRFSQRIMHTHCHAEALLRERSGVIPGQLTIE